MAKKEAASPAAAAAKTVTTAAPSLLDSIVENGRLGKDDAAKSRGRDMVSQFVEQVLQGNMTVSKDIESMIESRIAQIDHLLSLQLNEILHHPKFQQLEATWRGIRHLIEQSETGVMLKIKLFNINKRELLRDLQRVPEWDHS